MWPTRHARSARCSRADMQGWIGTTDLKRKTQIDLDTRHALFSAELCHQFSSIFNVWVPSKCLCFELMKNLGKACVTTHINVHVRSLEHFASIYGCVASLLQPSHSTTAHKHSVENGSQHHHRGRSIHQDWELLRPPKYESNNI